MNCLQECKGLNHLLRSFTQFSLANYSGRDEHIFVTLTVHCVMSEVKKVSRAYQLEKVETTSQEYANTNKLAQIKQLFQRWNK